MLATLDQLFKKRFYKGIYNATEAQTYISIFTVFHAVILAIKEVAILGCKILGSVEWQNYERPRGVRGMLP